MNEMDEGAFPLSREMDDRGEERIFSVSSA